MRMKDQMDASPDQARWTDEDVFHARRRAIFRSMILAITVGIAIAFHKLSEYYQSQAGPNPSPQALNKVHTLETLSVCVFVVALVLGIWTVGGWLDYIQRRGSREPEKNDPI